MAFDGRLLSGVGVMIAVVEAGSFVRASEALGLTQSGVSRAVARLEQRVGVRLFDRTSRAVSLTDEGRRFYESVAPLLSGIEEAAIETAGSAARVQGRLRVSVDPWFSKLVLAPRLKEFIVAHPELTVDLTARDRLGDPVAEGIDLVIRFGFPEPSSLIARKLMDTRVVTCAAPGYLARKGRPATPQDLETQGHGCLHFRDPLTGRPFPWEFHRQDARGGVEQITVPVLGRLIVNDPETMFTVCLAGGGIAQMLEFSVREHFADGRLVDLFPDWPEERFPLYAYLPSRHMPPAKVRAFLDFVVSLVRDY